MQRLTEMFFRNENTVLSITFPRYTRFGPKLALFFGLAKIPKYKTIFPSRQIPKSLVACVMPSVFYLFQFSVSLLHRFKVRSILNFNIMFNKIIRFIFSDMFLVVFEILAYLILIVLSLSVMYRFAFDCYC
jgi:hypothetical protein